MNLSNIHKIFIVYKYHFMPNIMEAKSSNSIYGSACYILRNQNITDLLNKCGLSISMWDLVFDALLADFFLHLIYMYTRFYCNTIKWVGRYKHVHKIAKFN